MTTVKKRTRKLKTTAPELSKPAERQGPVPAAAPPKVVPQKAAAPPPPLVDLSSRKAEFSLKLGSFTKAQGSMLMGFLGMVLMPAVLALVVIAAIGTPHSEDARIVVSSMNFALTVIFVLAVPMMVGFWAYSFYPKGSVSRLLSGAVLASLVGLWLFLVLLGSDLHGAFSAAGVASELNWFFGVVCLTAVFICTRALSELLDERKAWRRRMGARVEPSPPSSNRWSLDFAPCFGKYCRGNSAAWMTYFKYLVIPVFLLVEIDWMVTEVDFRDRALLEASIATVFRFVMAFGLILIVVSFLRWFYPRGSMGRFCCGLMRVPILIAYSLGVLMGSGLEDALEKNQIIVDMSIVILPVLMYILFMFAFDVSELVDRRRVWKRSAGVAVEPYMLEGPYKRHFDFGRRYASYAEGAKRAQKALNKYAFYRILLVVIVEVVVVSVYQYPGNSLISEDIKATFDENFNVSSMVSVFLLLAAASTVGTFFTYSYKEGSFARLVMAGLVAACSVLWAMFYYGSIAAQVHPESTMWAILLIMGAALLITGARGLYELHTKFLMNRDWYLTTRLYLVGTEAKYIKPKPETAPGQVSTIAPPGSLNGRGA